MGEGLELRHLVDVLKRRCKLIYYITGLAVAIALIINNILPTIYEANATMRIKYAPRGNDPTTMATSDELNKQILTYVEIIKSRAVVEAVIDKEYGDAAQKPSYDELVKSINAQSVKNTEVLSISVQATSALQAQKITNALVEKFNDRLVEIVRYEGKEARVFLSERLADAKADLDKAEKTVVNYKKSKNTVSVSNHTNMYLDKQSTLIKQVADNQLAMAASQAKLNDVNKQLANQNPNFIADNPLVQQYRGRLAEQEVELIGLRKTLTANHPKVMALQATIAETKSKLKAEIEKVAKLQAPSSNPVHLALVQNKVQSEMDVAAYGVQKNVLARLEAEVKKEILTLPEKEQGLARMLLDHSVAEATYTMLAKRYEESRINEATQSTNVQIVDMAALPEKPVQPRRMANLAIAVLIGLYFGVVTAFIAEYFYKTIDTTEDIKMHLSVSVIGSIPSYQFKRMEKVSLWQKLLNKLGPKGRRAKK